MASVTSPSTTTPTATKSPISDQHAPISDQNFDASASTGGSQAQLNTGPGSGVRGSSRDVRPNSSTMSEDSTAMSLATESSQSESYVFGMEKGFWRVQQGAQELLRFADLYRMHRDNSTPGVEFPPMQALPKEIDLVSMTQLSWGLLHAVGDLNVHNRRATESFRWMHDDDKSSRRRPKRSRKRAGNDLEAFTACKKCGVINTPRWRDGPAGPLTLCNVCGLLYAKRSRRQGSTSESHWRHAESPGVGSGR